MPALAFAAAALAALVVVVVHSSADPRPSAGASTRPSAPTRPRSAAAVTSVRGGSPAAVRRAAAWVAADLPSNSPVLTDGPTARLLVDAGRAAVLTDAAAWRSADYVVETPRLRDRARTTKPLAAALAAAIPVAEFGAPGMPAAQRTVVARLLPVGKAAALADVAHDARARRQADAELLSNSSVHIARRARAAFASGSVDLRAATLLALMAQVGDVKVVSVGRVAAESAAGLPVRRISLALPDRSALPQTLAMLPATYRPTSVLASAVVCRLTWPVQMPPFRSVQ